MTNRCFERVSPVGWCLALLACAGDGAEPGGDAASTSTGNTSAAATTTSAASSSTDVTSTSGTAGATSAATNATSGATTTGGGSSSAATGSVSTGDDSTGSAQGGSGGAGAAGQTATVNSTGSGGAGGGQLIECGLPLVGAPGQPKPSGTAGELTVLDWAGYQAAVSYTFDDANSSQIANYDALNTLGVPFTFYLQTNKSDAANPIWAQALGDGHELGNHSHSHPQTASGADVDMASSFIEENFGVRPTTMAAPYGDSSYQAVAQERFFINRGVSNALIAPNDNTNPFNLPCFIPAEGAAAGAFDAQIDEAQSAGSWRVVLVHGFSGGTDGAYQPVSLAEFVASVEHAKSLGDVWIDTVENIGAYWIGQKLLSSATPSTSGESRTWSWTLPDNFPSGRCLRVRVEGGSLSQQDQALAWDEHGYYTIALDAGSLTLDP